MEIDIITTLKFDEDDDTDFEYFLCYRSLESLMEQQRRKEGEKTALMIEE